MVNISMSHGIEPSPLIEQLQHVIIEKRVTIIATTGSVIFKIKQVKK